MTDFEHGTLGGYSYHKCRCEACRRCYCAYMKRLRHERFIGAPSRLVDATPAHEHIAWLREQGMSTVGITAAAGRKRQWLYTLLNSARCQPSTLARVLAIQPHQDHRARVYVDSAMTTERLRDLARLGWSMRSVAAELGMGTGNVRALLHGDRPKVRRATALAVLKLHQQRGGTPGPSKRTARLAAAQFPDDLAPTVCPVCEDTDDLCRVGVPLPQVADRVGLRMESLVAHLKRHDRRDLIPRRTA